VGETSTEEEVDVATGRVDVEGSNDTDEADDETELSIAKLDRL
jgi:hypothetical protein